MLHPVLSFVCDGLARCTVMRLMDLQEMEILAAYNDDGGSSGAAAAADHRHQQKEFARQQREDALVAKLRSFVNNKALVEKDIVSRYRAGGLTREIEDTALASAYALTRESFEGSPFRRDMDVAALFDISSEAGRIFLTLETKKKASTDVEALMEKLLGPSGDDGGVRSLLLEATRTWRTVLFLFQRYIGFGGGATSSSCNICAAVATQLRQKRQHFDMQLRAVAASSGTAEAVQRPPSIQGTIAPVQSNSSSAGSSKLSSEQQPTKRNVPSAANVVNAPPPPPPPRAPVARPIVSQAKRDAYSQKWAAHIPLVRRMQARCRGRILRLSILTSRNKNVALTLRNRRLQQSQRMSYLKMSVAKAYKEQIPVVLRYHQTLNYLEKTETRLADFYETEEDLFNAQWLAYVKKMTSYFLKDCPLDVDWIRKMNPAMTKPYFINVKTGKIQEENPNALKIVAGKNRQWVKATRAREERLEKARREVAQLNKMRAELLPQMELQLCAPIFM